MNPYFLMAVLYVFLALLTAVDASLTSGQIFPWFNGLRWLRVHLIILGVLVQVLFGILPLIVAARAEQTRPKMRWDIWLTLNSGLLILLVGIPMMNVYLIIGGATLVFIAAALLLIQLRTIGTLPGRRILGSPAGQKFYLAGLAFLLLGIFLGAGIWSGWGRWLHLTNVKEVHVHTNLWGFVSLTFAGLLVDLYPDFGQRPLAWPRSITPIFWLMSLGALGLVVGPWAALDGITTVGLILHTIATLWLLANIIKLLRGDRRAWTPGMIHLVTAYVWFLMPVVVAPLIVINEPNFPVAQFEQNGGPILVYGWMLQFGYALLPYLFSRAIKPKEAAQLGGSWPSLITVHVGGVFFWLGLMFAAYQPALHGTAFAFWALSLWPVATGLGRTLRTAFASLPEYSEERGVIT